jgi:hypothetical protein
LNQGWKNIDRLRKRKKGVEAPWRFYTGSIGKAFAPGFIRDGEDGSGGTDTLVNRDGWVKA